MRRLSVWRLEAEQMLRLCHLGHVVYLRYSEVLVSLSFSPLRHELLVVQQMRRLSALRLEADMVVVHGR